MKHATTKVFIVLIFIIWLGNDVFAGNPTGSKDSAYSLPVDSPKKEPAAAAPAPQMLTFPVSSDICKIKFNSYTQVRFQYYQPDKDTSGKDLSKPNSFDLRNARIILNGSPLKNFAYRLQVDFAPPTVRALDAYGSYTFFPYLKATLGQQKVPISYESLRTDYDIHSVSRSQSVEALTGRSKDVIATANSTTAVNNNGRDLGFLLSGGIPNKSTPGTFWVDYFAGVFQGQGINFSDADRKKDFAARVVVHPIKGLQVGGSVLQGHSTYGIDKKTPKERNRLGFDAEYQDGKWIYAAAEYLSGTDSATDKGGYYVVAEGFFIPKKGSILVKYDTYDPNHDKDNDATTITSVAFNWYFAPFTKIQIQYDMVHENSAETQKKNNLFSIQGQIFF